MKYVTVPSKLTMAFKNSALQELSTQDNVMEKMRSNCFSKNAVIVQNERPTTQSYLSRHDVG
jgi:hypothetical protein